MTDWDQNTPPGVLPGGRFHERAKTVGQLIAKAVEDIDTVEMAEYVATGVLAQALAHVDREAEIRTWVMALGALQRPDPAAVITEQITKLGGPLP